MNTGSKCVPSTSGLLTTVAYQLGEGNSPVPQPYHSLSLIPSHNISHPLAPTSSPYLAGGPVTYALEGSVAYAGLLIQVHCTKLHHIPVNQTWCLHAVEYKTR